MEKISRRKFFGKCLVYNTTVILGGGWFLSCSKDSNGAEFNSDLEYLPIQHDNPAIALWREKCEECGDCIEACAEKQKVFGAYQASASKHVCIHCGTCIKECEEGAITEKYHWRDVLDAIDNPSKIVIASLSPSVRVGIGDYFGLEKGSFMLENMVGACRAAGFDYVLDTNFSADLTIMEEAWELQRRITEKVNIPQFTSCCPAWVKYVEIFYPSLLKYLSTVKSPISMQGSMVKSYFAQKKGIDPRDIIHVAVTPCSAKKYEITREELSIDSLRSADFVITTNELSKLFTSRNIDLTAQTGSFDSFMGAASGAGIIFGNTGGVTRAALRTVYYNITGANPPDNLLELQQIQGLTGLKEAQVSIGATNLNVAVCYEMRNAQKLLEQVMNGSCKYHFIEVMACKGGCVGGAGQPAGSSTIQKRIGALNMADQQAPTRYCHENPEIKAIYKDFLGTTGGTEAKKYLHTTYNNKSHLL
ncbi:MAG: [FeFe] hydrogenase, group A [Bacteroidetes bacterium]|nr:[FeFe] hydrogenase, group A [Bacteroidota bacterium]